MTDTSLNIHDQLSHLVAFLDAFTLALRPAHVELGKDIDVAHILEKPWPDFINDSAMLSRVQAWLAKHHLAFAETSSLPTDTLEKWAIFNAAFEVVPSYREKYHEGTMFPYWSLGLIRRSGNDGNERLADLLPPAPLEADPHKETQSQFIDRAREHYRQAQAGVAFQGGRVADPPTKRLYHYRWAVMYQCQVLSYREIVDSDVNGEEADSPAEINKEMVRAAVQDTLKKCGLQPRGARRGVSQHRKV